jgi:hypothetical protein
MSKSDMTEETNEQDYSTDNTIPVHYTAWDRPSSYQEFDGGCSCWLPV